MRPRKSREPDRLAELVGELEIGGRLAYGGHTGGAADATAAVPGHLFFRVTSRVALQSLETPAEVVTVQPGGGRSVLDVRRRNVAGPAGLGRQDPHDAALGERGQRIDQGVNEVAVAVPPPEDRGVHDLVIVLIEELRAREILDVVTQVEVDVVVITELLNQIPVFETQFFRHIYRSGGVGLAHVLLLCFVNCFMFLQWH